MWITRDKAGLMIWNTKPYFDNEYQEWFSENPSDIDYIELDSNMFPEITFENSPIEIFLYTKNHLEDLLNVEYSRGFEEGTSYGFDLCERRD